VISDTHGLLRNEVYAAFDGADLILHAGDVGDPAILTELEVVAPVLAVYGNVDSWEVREQVPEVVEAERLGHKLVVIHGHQWGSPRVSDLVTAYPDASVIVYGHTHQTLMEKVGKTLVLNPGSAGHQRFGKPVSVALLSLVTGGAPGTRIIDLLR
jgi:putative phosphoesterase